MSDNLGEVATDEPLQEGVALGKLANRVGWRASLFFAIAALQGTITGVLLSRMSASRSALPQAIVNGVVAIMAGLIAVFTLTAFSRVRRAAESRGQDRAQFFAALTHLKRVFQTEYTLILVGLGLLALVILIGVVASAGG